MQWPSEVIREYASRRESDRCLCNLDCITCKAASSLIHDGRQGVEADTSYLPGESPIHPSEIFSIITCEV